jgi:hypothetical protein
MRLFAAGTPVPSSAKPISTRSPFRAGAGELLRYLNHARNRMETMCKANGRKQDLSRK